MEDSVRAWALYWVLTLLASIGVLVVFLLFATNALGRAYNPAIVWTHSFGNATLHPGTFCELERTDELIRRPITACFSVCFVWTGFCMCATAVMDMAKPAERRNIRNLMERETYWGLLLGLGPISIGFISYLALASSTMFWDDFLHAAWWVCINFYAAHAWARALQFKQNVYDAVVVFSWPSLPPLLVLAVALNVLLVLFREEIIRADGEVALVFLLMWNLILPVYLHWRFYGHRASALLTKFAIALLLGAGAFTLLLFSPQPYLCPNAQSWAQPYAAFQVLAAMACWQAFCFFRADSVPHKYRVLVQNQREASADDMLITSAYFVPADDPYASQSRSVRVPNAVLSQQQPANPRVLSNRFSDGRGGGGLDSAGRMDSGRFTRDSERRLIQRDGSERGLSNAGRRDSIGSQASDNSRRNLDQQMRRSRGNSLGGELPIVMAVPLEDAGGRAGRALSMEMEGGSTRPLSGSFDYQRTSMRSINSGAQPPIALALPVSSSRSSVSLTNGAMAAPQSSANRVVTPARPSFHEEVIPTPMPTSARPQPPTLPERRASTAATAAAAAPQSAPRQMGRLAAQSMDEGNASSRSIVVPGRSRRSSVERPDNPALRVLNSGGERSVERERALSGVGLDSRTVHLRTPEEVQQTRQSLLLASDQRTANLDAESMTTEQRLENLRRQRAQMQRERGSSNYQ